MSNPSNQYDILRGIGRWDLVALMVNITIGSGILGLPSKLFALTGVYSVLALVLCAALLAIVAICFAEVGSRFTGRKHIGGIEVGTRLRAQGMAAEHRGRLAILNPAYALVVDPH